MATPEAHITVQETQRLLFRRMIDARINPEVSMMIMAFWMWLESQGCEDLVKKISSHDAKFLTLVSNEGEAVLAALKPNSTSPRSQNLMPNTSNLSQCSFSIEDKFVNKEAILKGIEDLYKNSCLMLFEDILEERGIKVDSMTNKGENGAAFAKAITRWIWSNGEGPSEPTAPLVPSRLNPFAREWNPVTERAPEEDRCLFLTFSNGFPLTKNQIARFFTSKYGPCIERVYVHCPDYSRDPPLFAKVVFNASYIPAMILGRQRQRSFFVDGRALRCKRFDRSSQRRSGHGREN